MRNKILYKICVLSILLAIGVSISLIDGFVSSLIFPYLPGVKIGIANIIILIIIYQYDFKESITYCILKSIIVGLLFSGITTFIIGGIASLLSFLIMFLMHRLLKDKISMISISFVGGMIHIISQLLVVSLLYKIGTAIYSYGVYLVLISIITSVIVGVVGIQTNKLVSKITKSKE